MKKYFILATAAAVALASCSKVVMDETPDQEINFNAVNYVNSTKADPDTHGHLEFYSAGTFVVNAYFSAGNFANIAGSTQYMENIDITKSQVSGDLYAWKPATSYFWPKAGKLSFIGYYPTGATGAAVVDAATNSLAVSFTNYTVAGTLDAQKDLALENNDKNDLMVSDPMINQTSNDETDPHYANGTTLAHGVSMLFHHTLAKVAFKAQLKNYDDEKLNAIYAQLGAQINQIEIRDIDNKATFDGAAWGDPTNTTKVSSGNFVNNAKVGATVNGGALPTAATGLIVNTSATAQGPEYYVLPQSLSADTKVVYVKYTVYTTAGDKVVDAVEKEATVALNLMKTSTSAPINVWEINKKYIYTIIIDPFADEIYFDPAVVDFETPVEGSYEIK